jgi:glycosyltransferase involved in cell wall biosynthesis
MAHGRPLLLSDIPENREVGGEAAVYFRCGDARELQKSLEYLLGSETARADLSARARRRAEETYNWDHIADQTESFYYRAMER